MSKRKRIAKEEQWIREGRGSGRGANYKPWLTIQDVPSSGRVSRIKGNKINRQHEMFSDLERNYFYISEFSDLVVDIREQFPLLPKSETIVIANELGIKHPTNPKTNEPVVMTTDFLLTIEKDNRFIDVARTIKMKDELLKERVIEKFEIERVY
ncbi:TnsA endonuclease N-terminal domain-containing protein [Bacillus sp. FSL W8-1127]|uniref:TnsA endonuclease N-terminal domain-containing protein n=1 Tax=Bacillus sp. FSL W8-1127 TaxID=2954710 RepID=UPI0030FA7103